MRGQCGMLVLVIGGMLAGARPLPVSSRGRDEGEVVRLSSAVRIRQEGGVVPDPGLIVWPGLLGLSGPQSFGFSLADVLWAAWPSD
jgi:hypothetical protein